MKDEWFEMWEVFVDACPDISDYDFEMSPNRNRLDRDFWGDGIVF